MGGIHYESPAVGRCASTLVPWCAGLHMDGWCSLTSCWCVASDLPNGRLPRGANVHHHCGCVLLSSRWVLRRPLGCFAEPIQAHDIHRFGIKVGSHVFQTLLETLAVLVAVRCWAPAWKGSRATLRARSDSLSTLGAINKLCRKRPGIASIMRELALDCSEEAYTLQILEHVLGTQNEWADALSRVWRLPSVGRHGRTHLGGNFKVGHEQSVGTKPRMTKSLGLGQRMGLLRLATIPFLRQPTSGVTAVGETARHNESCSPSRVPLREGSAATFATKRRPARSHHVQPRASRNK